MSPPTQAPTAAELLANPVVSAALEQAWSDSQANDPLQRHEEGGWIYLNLTTGTLEIRRTQLGDQSHINLDWPPTVSGATVVGVFHTHPNPVAEGWKTGPSYLDTVLDNANGVPDLIRAEDGVHFSGPASRRGGLVGGPGYPP